MEIVSSDRAARRMLVRQAIRRSAPRGKRNASLTAGANSRDRRGITTATSAKSQGGEPREGSEPLPEVASVQPRLVKHRHLKKRSQTHTFNTERTPVEPVHIYRRDILHLMVWLMMCDFAPWPRSHNCPLRKAKVITKA
jgi:hypothetical protein